MIPSDKTFNGNEFYEHDGKRYYRWYNLKIDKPYIVNFKLISSNSVNKQGIVLFFSDFQGELYVNNHKVKILKGFKHYLFKTQDLETNDLELQVYPNKGHLFFGNASEDPKGIGYECGAFGCAFWIEAIDYYTYRFHCNDHEYDDDFDDLVFDVTITKYTDAKEWLSLAKSIENK